MLPFLALYRTYNTGIAFSMFAWVGDRGLIVLSLAVIAFVLYLARASDPRQVFARIGFALIIGGALGNLIDRAIYGHVIDYILFHTPVWSFAVFNLADAFISVGAGAGRARGVPRPGGASAAPRDLRLIDRDNRPRRPQACPARPKTRDRVSCPSTFKAILITRDEDKKQSVAVTEMSEADLMDGDVTVAVEATTVNYKDGLAITGKAPVVRRFPLVPGIDFAGTVLSSDHPDWRAGDKVILNGWGTSARRITAPAQRSRVKGDWLVPLPEGMSARDAMAVGTAGYTAMLSVMALERHGITPDRGPVVVTGAAGGVGSVAIVLLAKAGWHVIASTGRMAEQRLPEGPRRGRDHRPRGAVRPGQAARQGALGGRHRRGRQPHAGQRAVDDVLRRRGCRLRPGAGHGPALQRGALHPARRLAARHRFGDGAEGVAARGLAPHRHRSRPRQARGALDDDRLRRHPRRRPATSSTARSAAASSSTCENCGRPLKCKRSPKASLSPAPARLSGHDRGVRRMMVERAPARSIDDASGATPEAPVAAVATPPPLAPERPRLTSRTLAGLSIIVGRDRARRPSPWLSGAPVFITLGLDRHRPRRARALDARARRAASRAASSASTRPRRAAAPRSRRSPTACGSCRRARSASAA